MPETLQIGKRSLLSLLAVLLLLSACETERREPPFPTRDAPPAEEPVFRIDGTLDFLRQDGEPYASIDIEIADTEPARRQGLMHRTSIPPDTGMLFIFDREEMQSFWMANTPISLDIIFVNGEGRIVNIAKYTRPFSHENVRSERPAQYVVEVQAGFTDRRGVLEGDRIEWRRTDGTEEVAAHDTR